MELPIYDNAAKKGEDGNTIVKRIVEAELNWRFRKNHLEDDFGIDAFIDVINDSKQVTGKFINLQIKTGQSYFKEKNEIGWIYRGEMRHLNYYLNHDSPVIILLVDEKTQKVYWNLCDPKKTEKAGNNWKITIPFSQIFQATSKIALEKCVSPVIDYVSQLDYYWKTIELLTDHERIIINIRKEVIVKGSFDLLIDTFENIGANERTLKHCRNRIDIYIDDYNFDERELFEIAETKKWIVDFSKKIQGWSYYLAKDSKAVFLRLMQVCYLDKFVIKDGRILIDPKGSMEFLAIAYNDLNELSEKHEIVEVLNQEVSKELEEYLLYKESI